MKRGALPPRTPHPFKPLRQYLTANLPTPTGPFSYGASLTFPMAGNDQYGDCTIAGLVHAAQIQASVVGEGYSVPDDNAILNEYWSLTGGQDTGLELSQVITAWTAGTLNSQIAGAATIDIRDEALMAQALYSFGCLYVAANLPESAERQFPTHPWTLGGDQQPAGGHCVVLNGVGSFMVHHRLHRVSVKGFQLVTWGQEFEATDSWWRYFGAEAWVVIPQVYVDAGHDALSAVNLAAMQADVAQLRAAA